MTLELYAVIGHAENLTHKPIFVALAGLLIAAALLYFAALFGLRALLEAIETRFQQSAAQHRQQTEQEYLEAHQ